MQEQPVGDKNEGFKQGIWNILLTVAIAVGFYYFEEIWYGMVDFSLEANRTHNVLDMQSVSDTIKFLEFGVCVLALIGVYDAVRCISAVVHFIQAIILKSELPTAYFVMGVLCLPVLISCMIGIVGYIFLFFSVVD